MPNYSQGKIYKIVCNETGEIYIGSTTCKYLSQRLQNHRSLQNKCSCKHIIKRGNYDMVLIENFPCTGKQELHKRERYWIENINCINLVRPIASPEDKEELLAKKKEYRDKPENKAYQKEANKKWKEENREAHMLQRKEYGIANKEKIAEARKKYRDENKEKIKEQKRLSYLRNKEKTQASRKTYREENKDKLAMANKKYYEENKDKIAMANKKNYEEKKAKEHKEKTPTLN